jgi:DNA-binding SARP family transcriptional activator
MDQVVPPTVEFRILGPLEVVVDGTADAPRAAKERALLGLLLMVSNRVVSAERLVEDLWEGDPPDTAKAGLRVYVSRLRKFLITLGLDDRLVTRVPGYLLVVHPGELDAARFEALVARGRAALDAGDPEGAAATFRQAEALWRGAALPEVCDAPLARAEASRLDEERLSVLEERVDADLAAGRHVALVAELEAMTSAHPLRERLWAARIVALYRSGRQADALRAYQELRGHLVDELGIAPSSALVALDAAVIAQDPLLAWREPAAPLDKARPSGVVTFLLTDIEGSTPLWETHRRVMGDVVARHEALLAAAVAAHGGSLVKLRGEGDATFSVFTLATDAAGAALDAQSALMREAWSGGVSLRVRMALHTGEAVERDGDYFGGTVNRAARLREHARGGQIVVSGATADIIADQLDDAMLTELGERALTGLARNERVFELATRRTNDGERGSWADEPVFPAALARTATGVFVGRQTELERLEEVWSTQELGTAGLVLLTGEPGIGKTRLAAEFARRRHEEGAMVMFGRSDEDAGEPYQPFAEAVRASLQTLSPDLIAARLGTRGPDLSRLVPDFAAQLGTPPPSQMAYAEDDRRSLFDAVSAYIVGGSHTTPVLVVLDDLHWASGPTLLLLRHLLRADGVGKVLVVATYRHTDVDRSHPLADVLADLRREVGVTRVALGALDAAGVADYLEAVSGQGLDAHERELARVLHGETEGNPFFLVESLRHLVETGAFYREEGRWHADVAAIEQAGIPEGVRDVVTRRFSRLSEATNRLLTVASVVGSEFDLALLGSVSGAIDDDDTLLDAAESATSAGLVLELRAGAYTFSHALIRQILYEELSSTRRARMHRQIGEAIEARGSASADVEALAHHFAEAALDGQALKAAHYALAAAIAAADRFATDQAENHVRRGLEALDLDDDPACRADLLHVRAEGLWANGDATEAKAVAHQEAALARTMDDADRLGRAAILALGTVPLMNRDGPTAALALEAIEALDEANLVLRARLLAALAIYRAQCEGDGPGALELAREAQTLARQAGDPAALAAALYGLIYGFESGSTEELLRTLDGIDDLARTLGDRQLHCTLLIGRASANVEAGDIEGLERTLDEFEALGAAHGWRRPTALAAALRFGWAMVQGRFDEADVFEDAAMAAAGSDLVVFIILLGGRLMRALHRGDEKFLDGIGQVAAAHFESLLPLMPAALAFVDAIGGRFDAAREQLARIVTPSGVALPPGPMLPFRLSAIAVAVRRMRDPVLAAIVSDALQPFAGTILFSSLVATLGSADSFLGALAGLDERWDAAEAYFEAAIDLERSYGARPLVATSQYWYARMLLDRGAAGDGDRAWSLLTEARAMAVALGMAPLAAATAEHLGDGDPRNGAVALA